MLLWRKQVVHLVANLSHLDLAGNLFLRHLFCLSAHSVFIKIFCGDKAMHCLHFANINGEPVVACPLHKIP
ncbi:hypothetical protein [Klebsiella pneumoniae IS33]|nr:hypothetical protein N559_5058 [Klebsiella pneumoniae JM45]EOZ66599.1 hypothetical protein H254_3054 [Klebsiella pneumoniae KP-11]CDK95008.1 hypothetical protein [Klebsiella pneumoniae IS33]